MSVAAKGNWLGLELAKAGTNFVVRRKTLFESAERADWLRIFFHLNGPGLRGANPAAQIFYVFGRGYLTRARGGWKPPFHGLRTNSTLLYRYYYIGRLSGYLTRAGAGGDRHLLHRMGRKRRRNRGGAIFFLKRTEKDLHGFCRICNFASGMKPSFHFSPVLSGTLEYPYIRQERNEKEDFFVKFLII